MEFLCYASGTYHKNIYITTEFDEYLCWHDLSAKDRAWHHARTKELATSKANEAKKRIPSQDLYIFDDIHMDTKFNPDNSI